MSNSQPTKQLQLNNLHSSAYCQPEPGSNWWHIISKAGGKAVSYWKFSTGN